MRVAFKPVLGLSLAVCVAVGAGALWRVMEDPGDGGGPRGTADCARVMEFARMAPPAGMRNAKCDDPESEGCFVLAHDAPQPGRAAGLRMRITPEVGTTAKVRFDAS
ncbi:hypothetical protein ACIQK6_40180 [Streptomyces sp. NPDC091682]|uniref:hypothetical protein n=1 Tax=Streptomyces sp. NPDC091682 TaxID=3366005 RepID=UPI00380725B5